MQVAPPPALPLRIVGTGEYCPRRKVPSSAFDARWNKPQGWTERHSGVAWRAVAGADEYASAMGAAAARAALAAAGRSLADIDCIISACSVMEQPIPCSAALLQRELGLGASGVPAFDVNATCLSFVVALDLVSTLLASGRYRCVLIVSSELPSAGVNPDDPATAPLFGDGAAAVLVEPADPHSGSSVLAARMETYAEAAAACQVRACGTRLRIEDGADAFIAGTRFEMDGKAVYRQAAARLPGFLDRLLDLAGLPLAAIDRIIPHQASGKALAHLQRALALPAARMAGILHDHGNQMAASIPAALHHAIQHQGLARGDTVLLIGSGAGMSFGGMVLRY